MAADSNGDDGAPKLVGIGEIRSKLKQSLAEAKDYIGELEARILSGGGNIPPSPVTGNIQALLDAWEEFVRDIEPEMDALIAVLERRGDSAGED